MSTISVIDHGGYASKKTQLEQCSLPGSADIIITLDSGGHRVQFQQQQFQLDYAANEFQSLLSSQHPLLTAIGKTRGSLLDACGGLGRDSFIMAHSGFEVTTCEVSLIIYTLLEQAVAHYSTLNSLKWETVHSSAQDIMYSQAYDIVYLDPMFQEKRSAKPKQNMQLLQIAADQSPFHEWKSAWLCAKKRLVIKQYSNSTPVPELPAPSYQVKGKRNIRFDVYIKA